MRLRTSLLLGCILFAVPVAESQSTPPPTRKLTAELTAAMPGILAKYGAPGAAIAIIRHGQVVWSKGFGYSNVAGNVPVNSSTIFNIGSLSKVPTAWAVMQLVEQHKIDLDAPADSYLTHWHLPPSSFDNQQVTVRRLLSHTSGIPNYNYHGYDPSSPLPPIQDSLAGKTGVGKVYVGNPPGTHEYSGANFAVLELMLEDQSGQPFADYMRSHIFRPLGMNHTQYGLPADFQHTMATPYDSLGKPLPLLRYNELAAAGLTTSIDDLARFAAAELAAGKDAPQGRDVLAPASVRLMQTPVPGTKWADQDPFGPSPEYGLGHTVRPDQFAGQTGVGHGGTNSGWESLVEVIPATGDGIVIATNSANGSAVIATVLCDWRKWGAKPGTAVPCPTVDISIPLMTAYKAGGVTKVIATYRKLHESKPESYDFSERELNGMGYQLMRLGDTSGAVELFKLNVEAFPDDWNVYDSLGEAYLKLGNQGDAIRNYQKSVQLNPRNDAGKAVLRRLGVS